MVAMRVVPGSSSELVSLKLALLGPNVCQKTEIEERSEGLVDPRV